MVEEELEPPSVLHKVILPAVGAPSPWSYGH
jgi:hypothetical protein